MQLHVNALKVLKFPTAMVSSLTHSSCDPGGHLQKQNSSIPKGQGCIGGGQSQVQLSSFNVLGRSQDKVHGVGMADSGLVVVAAGVGVVAAGVGVGAAGVGVVAAGVGVGAAGVGVGASGDKVAAGNGVVLA